MKNLTLLYSSYNVILGQYQILIFINVRITLYTVLRNAHDLRFLELLSQLKTLGRNEFVGLVLF